MLLGGWNTWTEKNTQDPNGYPIDKTPGSGTDGGKNQPAPGLVVTTPGPNVTPAGTVITIP